LSAKRSEPFFSLRIRKFFCSGFGRHKAVIGFGSLQAEGWSPAKRLKLDYGENSGRNSGLEHVAIGTLVWRRQHRYNWAEKRICQHEQYHIIHVTRFEPCMSDATEATVLDRFQWWTVTELARAVERLTPLSLAQIVATYIAQGPPCEPLQVEVLVD